MAPVLIFDFDGVIADSYKIALDIYTKIAPKYGLDNSEEFFQDLFEDNFYKSILKNGLPPIKLMLKINEFKKELMQAQDKVKLFPKMKAILEKLSKSNRLIIISSNMTEVVKGILDKNSIICKQF